MSLSGKVVTRALKFSLQKTSLYRTQRFSSIVLAQSYCSLGLHRRAKSANINCFFGISTKSRGVVSNQAMGALSPLDPSSFSRPELAVVKHISLSLNVDFDKKVLSGVATLDVDILDNITEVILDSSKLNIESVETDDGKSLKFNICKEVPNYGSKLTVTLKETALFGQKWLRGECHHCAKQVSFQEPVTKEDMKLAFTGFLYVPEMKIDEERRRLRERKRDFYNMNCQCFYMKEITRTGVWDYENRKISEQSLEEIPSKEEIFIAARMLHGKDNVKAKRGDIYVLGPNGSRHKITTYEELREVPKSCKDKSFGMPAEMYDQSLQTSRMPLIVQPMSLMADMYSAPKLPKQALADTAGKRFHEVTLKIKYTTSPGASALQWLEPNQTSGKTHPYMFSQCQPIHARSIIPCQDTPAVKFTYDAQVTAPSEFTVLMSALRGDVNGNTTSFRQPMPLPSYLFAIAVGQLESKYLGPRSRVWSEKETLDRSAWEFAETEHYLAAAEKMCGKYEWTEYDLLVLPPSFPYGGMENPCLTFVTPTLLAGDRSLADVIVHEIMHSWTGNLVTNRNFEHFWLNEGFTVFLERKVTASLIKNPEEAKKNRDFSSILGLQELTETINTFGVDSPMTVLVPDLQNVHPDDAFSRVPYEKGSLFLRYLEDLLGGPEVFDDFIRSYLSMFAKKSLETSDFKTYLYTYFKNDERLKQVDWETWLYKPGMPPVIPNYDTSMTKSVDDLVQRLSTDYNFSAADVVTFTPHQMIYLLQKLVDTVSIPQTALNSLYKEYRLGESKNAEIEFRWIRICIRSKDKTKLDEALNFVNSQGRMKYVRPIYRDLYAWEYARPIAIDNFLKNEKYMMHVSAYTLRKDLHLNES